MSSANTSGETGDRSQSRPASQVRFTVSQYDHMIETGELIDSDMFRNPFVHLSSALQALLISVIVERLIARMAPGAGRRALADITRMWSAPHSAQVPSSS